VMLLKQQVFTASGAANRLEQTFEYAFRGSHPLFQFLPQKFSELITKNLADELNLPPRTGPGDDWSSEDLNSILLLCFVADKRGNNMHTFNSLEFESDLYCGVMSARCYPFDMEESRFHGNLMNIKVDWEYSLYIPDIFMVYFRYIPKTIL
jgi:hypothetical protein